MFQNSSNGGKEGWAHGEQGGESIHPIFNRLMDTYGRMHPSNRRLLSMLKAHHVCVFPLAKQLKQKTLVGRRKRKSEDI